MLTRTAAVLLIAAAFAAAQDAAQMLDATKKEVLREGALQYRFASLYMRKGTEYFTVALEVKNVSETENVARKVWHTRFNGRKIVDDRGREYKGTKIGTATQNFLVPGQSFTFSVSLAGKPNPKAQTLYLTLPKSDSGPEVVFRIPFKMMVTK